MARETRRARCHTATDQAGKGGLPPTPTEHRLARVLDLSCLFLVFGRYGIENIRSPTVGGRTCKLSGSRGLLPQSLHLSQCRQVDEHIHRAGERPVLAEQRSGIGQETEAGAVRPFGASFDPSTARFSRIATAIGH